MEHACPRPACGNAERGATAPAVAGGIRDSAPEHVYDYDMRTRERIVRKVQEVPSGHDPTEYATRRIMAPSHDGEAVPVSPPEWPEWGNPIESEVAYECIAAYNPYDNVEAKDYPHVIATAGLTDPRVTYWEPAKWVAKLRAAKTDD